MIRALKPTATTVTHQMSSLPSSTRAIVLRKSSSDQKPVYHDAILETRPIEKLKQNQVLLKIGAIAFNHRDVCNSRIHVLTILIYFQVWVRKGMYPGIGFDSVFGSDGAGTVVASFDPQDSLLNKRVFMTPMRGWKSDPFAPESKYVSYAHSQIQN